jgi:S-methylmethionine-dependent homocysteine/selenocysteine methylase
MKNKRTLLPHQTDRIFLTDGGIETSLIFLDGFELPYFAAFDLLKDENGWSGLRDYFLKYLNIAKNFKAGFILESPTWRASPDWIDKLGYPESDVYNINEKAIQLMSDLKKEFENVTAPILISGCIGPRGDGYKAENKMSAEQAAEYHSKQIEAFCKTPADMITAITMNYVEEAEGIARTADRFGIPSVISFTVETDGKLPDGSTLKNAIEKADGSTQHPPVYYMINCAHPSHFFSELQNGANESWTKRIKGIRANASQKSHAELDEATELDIGNPGQLGNDYKKLKDSLKQLNVFGGCCGTDERHIGEIAKRVL